MLPAKFGSIWPSSFRGEDIFNISQSEKRIILGGHVYGHPIRTLIILVQDKNTSLKLPVGVSPLQLVNLHRNQIFRHRIFLIIDLNKTRGSAH
jgi:hypothetical protein